MKVRYIGDYYKVALSKGETYAAEVEDGMYRIFIEAYDDYFLFQPAQFEIVA